MIAYQMIYTACGKDKNGAFSVWSQSKEVTKQESEAVYKFMMYRTPASAPFEPTEEELATLYPKKYGYFELPSGRKCIARSVYLGKVYSDLDMRMGNYIIHAYIFDDLGEFNQFGIFDRENLFKDKLTYAEWHDAPAPEYLPAVDMEMPPLFNAEDAIAWIRETGEEKAAGFLQAVMDAANSDEPVTFNDTEEKTKKIYGILGSLVPGTYRKALTFATQYVERWNASGAAVKPVKIRNIFPDSIGKAFKYEEAVAAGGKAFWFEKNICANITPGRYVKDIVTCAIGGASKFELLKKVQEVNKITEKAGCDADTAIAVHHLMLNEPAWFENAAEYERAFQVATKYNYINAAIAAKKLYDDVISTGKWGSGAAILPQLKFIYENCGDATKRAIINGYIADLRDYGVDENGSPQNSAAQSKQLAPFPWEDFAQLLVSDGSWENYVRNVPVGGKTFIVFDALCTALRINMNNKSVLAKGYSLAKIVFAKIVDEQDINIVKPYWEKIAALGRQNEVWFIKNCAAEYCAAELEEESELRYAFALIMLMKDGAEKAEQLYGLIHKNEDKRFLIPVYIEFSQKAPEFFAKFEQGVAKDAFFADFLFKKSGYEFMNAKAVTLPILKNYYETYFAKGHDRGAFKVKVADYIKNIRDEKGRYDACIEIYRMIRNSADGEIADILYMLSSEAVAAPGEDLLTRMQAQNREILEMNSRLATFGRQVPENFKLMYVALVCKASIYDGASLARYLADGKLYADLDNRELAEFTKSYFEYALDLYVYCRRKLKANIGAEELINAVFLPPVNISMRAADAIGKHLDEIKDDDEYSLILCDLMLYNAKNTDIIGSFVKQYIAKTDKKNIKKINKFVTKNITDEKQRETISKILGFQQKQKGEGLLSKLFGGLFGKDGAKSGGKK